MGEVDTATTSGVIMLMFFFTLILSQLFIRENLPHQIAALTTAPLLYLGARVANVDMKDMLKPAIIMIVFGMLPEVLAATYWPELSLWLSKVAGFIR